MKELQQKIKELYINIGELKATYKRANEEMKKCRDNEDTNGWDLQYDIVNTSKKGIEKLEKQVKILEEANMIMLGVE